MFIQMQEHINSYNCANHNKRNADISNVEIVNLLITANYHTNDHCNPHFLQH